MDGKFDRECAGILAKRGVKQLEDGSYQFARDRRVIAVRDMLILLHNQLTDCILSNCTLPALHSAYIR